MIWLQTLAFLVLAGLTQAQRLRSFDQVDQARKDKPTDNGYGKNSFPYHRMPLGLPNDDVYTSSVVSLSVGPLCSGFHIAENSVVTAASCVFREVATNLLVISHNSKDGSLVFLPVKELILNKKYNVKTDEHNLAVLVVNKNVSHQVPILKLPMLGSSSSDDVNSNVYLTKYTFGTNMLDFSSVTYPAEANADIRKCTNENLGGQVFVCVSKIDERPYSYGLADLGTPLIFRNGRSDVLGGIFTGHHYNVPKTHYLYQNVYANLNFLNRFASN